MVGGDCADQTRTPVPGSYLKQTSKPSCEKQDHWKSVKKMLQTLRKLSYGQVGSGEMSDKELFKSNINC